MPIPETGYHFVNRTNLAGTPVSTDATLTVMNITADDTYTANFAVDTFTVTFAAGVNGRLTVRPARRSSTAPVHPPSRRGACDGVGVGPLSLMMAGFGFMKMRRR